jgi:hypothetical protein
MELVYNCYHSELQVGHLAISLASLHYSNSRKSHNEVHNATNQTKNTISWCSMALVLQCFSKLCDIYAGINGGTYVQ